jgi:NAD(P)-dependent dehydrogenase (short-subunit alcohol dehydrogenase family)
MGRYLVFGGAGGMGAAGVRELLSAGHRVVVADRAEPPIELGAHGAVVVDALDTAGVTAAVDRAVFILGGLDGAWAHVGVEFEGTIEETGLDAFERAWRINVLSHAALAKAAIPHLRASGGGALLFTASSSGVLVEERVFAYTTTKASLIAMARQLACDYAKERIRVNVVCPGWVDTPHNQGYWPAEGGREAFVADAESQVPLGRIGQPEDIGRMAAMLLTDTSSYITGQAIVVDGGLSLKLGATR